MLCSYFIDQWFTNGTIGLRFWGDYNIPLNSALWSLQCSFIMPSTAYNIPLNSALSELTIFLYRLSLGMLSNLRMKINLSWKYPAHLLQFDDSEDSSQLAGQIISRETTAAPNLAGHSEPDWTGKSWFQFKVVEFQMTMSSFATGLGLAKAARNSLSPKVTICRWLSGPWRFPPKMICRVWRSRTSTVRTRLSLKLSDDRVPSAKEVLGKVWVCWKKDIYVTANLDI